MRRRHSKDILQETYQIVDRIQMALITNETKLAVEAYEGLRKAVLGAQDQRHAHIANLTRLHRSALGGADSATLLAHLDEMLAAAGIQILADPKLLGPGTPVEFVFDVVGGEGSEWEVLAPAYLDKGNSVAARGRLRAVKASRTPAEGPDGLLETTAETERATASEATSAGEEGLSGGDDD